MSNTSNILSTIVTLYKQIFNINSAVEMPLSQVIDQIRDGKEMYKVKKYRKTLLKSDKEKLPAFVCGIVEGDRKDENVHELQVFPIDFDEVPDYEDARNKLSKDKYIVVLYQSPTHGRLKAIVRIMPVTNNDELKELFPHIIEYFKNTYNLDIDKSGSNMSRLCFLSEDKHIHVNENAIAFEMPVEHHLASSSQKLATVQAEEVDSPSPDSNEKSTSPLKGEELRQRPAKPTLWSNSEYNDASEAIRRIEKIFSEATPGNRHMQRLKAAMLAGGYVAGGLLDEAEAKQLLITQSDLIADDGKTSRSETKTLRDGFFHGKKSPIYELLHEAQSMPKVANGEVYSEPPVPYFLSKPTKTEEKPVSDPFWKERDNGTIAIDESRFYRYLSDLGFRYETNNGNLIFISDSIYQGADNPMIISMLKKIFEANEKIYNAIIKNLRTLLQPERYPLLQEIQIEKYHDPADSCRLFFKNKIVEISAEEIVFKDYKDADYLIPKARILNHVISEECEDSSAFAAFIGNVCTNPQNKELDKETFATLTIALGYLLHYPAGNDIKPLILLTDRTSEQSSGRTGKSLIVRALAQMKGYTYIGIHGKENDFDCKFRFQSLNIDTELVGINDLKTKEDPDVFYNAATEGIMIERKGEQPIQLSINDAPKFILTSNSIPIHGGDSNSCRFKLIELHRFYNAKHTPLEDFGKMFFDGWNNDEFNSFFHYMFSCIQDYFRAGKKLPEPSEGYAKEKVLVNDIGEAMIEFLESLDLEVEYTNADLKEKCQDSNARLKSATLPKITSCLKKYAEYKGNELIESKSGG
ncbi:MAG: hypothetical protein JXR56_00475, partial [Candidatus Cloacimonetes bacterium]|nr:hypothetical protein [Candidatus Cloacimonadota bacterium]